MREELAARPSGRGQGWFILTDDRGGWHRPAPDRAARRGTGSRPAWQGARSCWSHPVPSPPGSPLGLKARPRDLATQQAAASVGQGLLMGYYTQLFEAYGLGVGQVLLTADDVTRHSHYRNALPRPSAACWSSAWCR